MGKSFARSCMNKGPSHQYLAYEQQIIFECRVQVPGNRYPGVKFGLETYKQNGNIAVLSITVEVCGMKLNM